MSFLTFKGSFAKKTSTGTQAITGVGFIPKALLLFATTQTADGFASNLQFSLGMTTGTAAGQNRAVASSSTNGVTTTACARGYQPKALSLLTLAGALDSECGLSSFDSNGFTLNWTTSSANAYEIHYVAFGGTDLTNAIVVDNSAPAATGNAAFTGYGFQPDFLFFIQDFGAGTGIAAADARVGTGCAISSSKQWAGSIFASSGSTAGINDTAAKSQRTDSCLLISSFGTDLRATLVSMDADGFTLNFLSTAVGRSFAALALKGGSYDVGSFSKTTAGAPASQSVTGESFAPKLALLQSWSIASSTSVSNGAKLSFGATDASLNEGTTWFEAQHRITPSVSNMAVNSSAALELATSTATADATAAISSFDSGGFTVSWSPNNAVAAEVLWATLVTLPTVAGTFEDDSYNVALVQQPDNVISVW